MTVMYILSLVFYFIFEFDEEIQCVFYMTVMLLEI